MTTREQVIEGLALAGAIEQQIEEYRSAARNFLMSDADLQAALDANPFQAVLGGTIALAREQAAARLERPVVDLYRARRDAVGIRSSMMDV